MQKLVLHVPKGYENEKLVLDTSGGKEQFYYYDDGSLLYFTRDVSWPTENESMISRMKKMSSDQNAFIYKGIDSNGLHWKELRYENFRFGYSYISAERLEQFEQAINAIRIK